MQLFPVPKNVKKQEGQFKTENIQHLAFLGYGKMSKCTC